MGCKLSAKRQAELKANIAKRDACSHPQDQRQTLGMGVYCKLCDWKLGVMGKQEFEIELTKEFVRQQGGQR